MVEDKLRYSDADLAEFKEILLKKIEKAQADLDLIRSAYMNDLNTFVRTRCASKSVS